MVCTYVGKPRELGLGHAVLSAKLLVGNDRFAVLLADYSMVGQPPVMQQMVEQFDQWRASILAVQDEPREQTNRYGIVIGQPVADGLVDVSGMAEKPALADAPSTLAVTCQYILTAGIFAELESLPRVAGGEIQLTDGIARVLRREKVFAYRYGCQRYECGSKLGIMQATADLGSQHDEMGG